MMERVNDQDIRVVFQACLSLGHYADPGTIKALVGIAERYGTNEWFRKAILTSKATALLPFFEQLVKNKVFFEENIPGKTEFITDLAHIIDSNGKEEEIEAFKESLASLGQVWREAAASGLSSYSTGAQ